MWPIRRRGFTFPPIGSSIDWGKAPRSLVAVLVCGPDTGSKYIVSPPSIAGDDSAPPFDSFARQVSSPPGAHADPMTVAEGHYWGGTPSTQASTWWSVPARSGVVPLTPDRGTWVVRQWAETTHGTGNGGMCFQNSAAIGNGAVWGRAPHSPDGTGDFIFGNVTAGNGAIAFTEPDLLTDYRTLMFSGSTGDHSEGDPAGLRVMMDSGKILAAQDVFSGAKADYSIGPWMRVGRGFWGVISYCYIFDAYITDVGFCEQFWEQPFYFFAEPRERFVSIPATCDDDLTDEDLISFRWDSGDASLVNRVVWEYDYDALADTFEKMVIFSHDESIRQYGPRPELRFRSKGLKSSLGADAFVEERAREIFARFGDAPPAVLQVQAFYRKGIAWEPGDIICLTSAFIPNLLRGERGLDEEQFELVDYRPQFGPNGRLVATLIDIEALTDQPAGSFTGQVSTIEPTDTGEPLTQLGLWGVGIAVDEEAWT